jgi:L-seryl-tRNA(Ser) seleniumtransferase
MAPEVAQAMVAASRHFVRMDQLQAAVGGQIARLTGSESALVTSGASAALTLAAAACLCGDDLARMDRLPRTEGMANQIVIARSHRNGYDHAMRAAGATLVEVGLAERTRDPRPWEIEAAITPETIAVAYCVGFSDLDLSEVIHVAHRHRLNVIVDASAALPPKRNLTAFTQAGADLVAFSGGKGLRGPQSSGILCGRSELIASAALQMLDMDHLPELWDPPESLIPSEMVARGLPNHGIGRGMKVGKEEIVALWTALAQFAESDEPSEVAQRRAICEALHSALAPLKGIQVEILHTDPAWPRLRIRVEAAIGHGAAVAHPAAAIQLARELEAGDPPIHVIQADARDGELGIDPFCLEADHVALIARRFEQLLGTA